MSASRTILTMVIAFMTAAANAQVVHHEVDILSAGDEGYEGIPSGLLVLDVFLDLAATDAWTAAGFQIFSYRHAEIRYFDSDPNTPGTQPGLVNPGLADRFLTSLSRPRGRNANARFVNAGAGVAGDYNEGGATPDILPNELDVAYFSNPPLTPGSPSVDGYIARIAVDISQTGFDRDELVVMYTPQTNPIVACIGTNQPLGFAYATFDVPALNGFSFWVIPEPACTAAWFIGLCVVRRSLHRP